MNNNMEQKLFFDWGKAQKVQEQIGYVFQNPQLLCQAFTTKSYSEEVKTVCNNEVLEFYGDKALDFVIMKKMSEYHGEVNKEGDYASKKTEGELTEMKKKLVCREMLSSRIKSLGFQSMLLCSVHDEQRSLREQESIQENLFEAILGAVAVDSKWDVDALTRVVDRMLTPDVYFKHEFNGDADYIKLLDQWCIDRHINSPKCYTRVNQVLGEYKYEGRVDILLSPHPFYSFGRNKQEAVQNAAKWAYMYLAKNNMLYSLEDEVGKLELEKAVNQLQELYQKGYIKEPTYSFEEKHDANGNVFWDCECKVEGLRETFVCTNPSKKAAKKRAAYNVAKFFLTEAKNDEA